MTEDTLIGRRLSHFRILSRLGEGGMGVVYRAEDENLGRQVALKVLQPEAVGDEEHRLRLMREARSAAAVTHPHIATIHEIDEVDGVIFIAMELVEGTTLSDAIAGGPLPMRYALRYGIEMAEALSRAHRAGVVHRDLKPENVVVSPDHHVKILDFGLAKLEAPPPSEEQMTRIQTISDDMTRSGRILGTPAYMSPEQARGLAVDARSDLFSFGIMLYEMVTGAPPFRGKTTTDTLLAIVRDEALPASRNNPEIPAELERIIAKCMEKAPEDRYQHADDIAVDLRRLRRDTDSQPVARVGSGPARAVEGSRPLWKRPLPLVAALLTLALLAITVTALLQRTGLVGTGEARVRSLAVLPLANLKDAGDPERLGQILQELIITDLSELEELTVLSSQRLFDIQEQMGHGDEKSIDRKVATEVASRAGAGTMLTGSLSRLGTRWILACQLVNVSDGSVIKSERIDGTDLYVMVDDLTAQIRDDLGLGAAAQEDLATAVKEKTTSSIEAYQHYLSGVDLLNARKYEEAVLELARAVDIDPQFGKAYYKLAVAGWWLRPDDAWWEEHDVREPVETLDYLLSGEVKISVKDRELAEAMRPLVARDYEDGRDPFDRLVRLYPDEKEAWYGLGEAYYHGRSPSPDKALAAFEKAVELDPSFQLPYDHILDIYRNRRQYAEAEAKARALVAIDPTNAAWYGDWVGFLIRLEDPQAEAELERGLELAPDDDARRELLHSVGRAYTIRGDDDKGKRAMERALELDAEALEGQLLGDLGLHHMRRWEMDEALRYFLESHEADPSWGVTNWNTASIYEQRGQFSEGILRYRSWVEKNPEIDVLHAKLIHLAVLRGDETEAARALDRAVETEEDPVEAAWYHQQAGHAYRSVGDHPRAAEAFARAHEIDPGNEEIRWALGTVDLRFREFDNALERFQALVDEGFDNEWFLRDYLDCLLAMRRFGRARAFVEGWPDRRAEENGWRGTYHRVLVLSGRLREAETFFESVQPWFLSDGERRDFFRQAAHAYLAAGQLGQAERLLRRAVELVPDVPDLWGMGSLVRGLELQGQYREAAQILAEMQRFAPDRHWNRVEAASLALLRGEHRVAERRIREFLEQGPNTQASSILALALCGQGRHAEAVPAARRVLERDPRRESVSLLAWALIEGEIDLDEGLTLAEQALGMPPPRFEGSVLPFMPSPRHCLGLAYLKRREYDKAVGMLTTAAAERPDRKLIQEHLEAARASGAP